MEELPPGHMGTGPMKTRKEHSASSAVPPAAARTLFRDSPPLAAGAAAAAFFGAGVSRFSRWMGICTVNSPLVHYQWKPRAKPAMDTTQHKGSTYCRTLNNKLKTSC